MLVGRVLAIAVALLGLRLSTAFLAPSEYGALAVLQAMQLLAVFFLTNPVVQYLNRKLHEWSEAGVLLHFLRLYLVYVNACAGLAALVALVWAHGGQGAGAAVHFALVFMGVLALAWGPVIAAFLNLLGHRIASIVLGTIGSLCGLGLSALLARLSPTGVSWFAGGVIANVLMGLLAYRLLAARIPPAQVLPRSARREGVELLRFALPLAVSAGFMWFLLSGYRLAFEHVWGVRQLGLAAVALSVATQVWAVLESLASQYLQPYLYRRMAVGDAGGDVMACSDYVNVIAPIYLGFAAVVATNAPLAFGVLVAGGYHGGLSIFVVAIYVELLRVLTNAFCMAAHARKEARTLIVSYLLAALTVAAGVQLVGYLGLGILSGSLVLLAGGAVGLVAVVIFMRRLVPFVPDRRAWGLGLLVAGSGAVMGMAALHSAPGWSWGRAALALASGVAFLLYVRVILSGNPSLARLVAGPQ